MCLSKTMLPNIGELRTGELLRTPLWRSSLCSIAPPRTESYVGRAMSL
jgi:hypothetical protein